MMGQESEDEEEAVAFVARLIMNTILQRSLLMAVQERKAAQEKAELETAGNYIQARCESKEIPYLEENFGSVFLRILEPYVAARWNRLTPELRDTRTKQSAQDTDFNCQHAFCSSTACRS